MQLAEILVLFLLKIIDFKLAASLKCLMEGSETFPSKHTGKSPNGLNVIQANGNRPIIYLMLHIGDKIQNLQQFGCLLTLRMRNIWKIFNSKWQSVAINI